MEKHRCREAPCQKFFSKILSFLSTLHHVYSSVCPLLFPHGISRPSRLSWLLLPQLLSLLWWAGEAASAGPAIDLAKGLRQRKAGSTRSFPRSSSSSAWLRPRLEPRSLLLVGRFPKASSWLRKCQWMESCLFCFDQAPVFWHRVGEESWELQIRVEGGLVGGQGDEDEEAWLEREETGLPPAISVNTKVFKPAVTFSFRGEKLLGPLGGKTLGLAKDFTLYNPCNAHAVKTQDLSFLSS